MIKRLGIFLGVLAAFGFAAVMLVRLAGLGATEFVVQGSAVEISGPITGAATERFERILEQNPRLRTVILGNMPGTSDANWLIAIGYMIHDNDMNVLVSGRIQNDAILLMLAGEVRRLRPNAELRVTDISTAARDGLPFDRQEVAVAERRGFIADVMGEDRFAIYVEELRTLGGAHILTAEEIDLFGLETEPE